ncbi:hypothetical protein Patl1_05574 [Pistacia atlantica]|uniref:Uncharacterized protein n=1 Tax=Pistacia atlantica TaxID=434234 RepID=A0ACC1BPY2_9ROSI|nr:hypothetical protein Patl1_05574 [Pistacia atlantica]
MTAMSLFKAVGPTGEGAAYSWAQKCQDVVFLLGDQMVFFILNVVEAIEAISTCKPFLTQRPELR